MTRFTKMDEFICSKCGSLFSRADNLQRHIENIHLKEKRLECPKCLGKFGRLDSFMRHRDRCTEEAQELQQVQTTFKKGVKFDHWNT